MDCDGEEIILVRLFHYYARTGGKTNFPVFFSPSNLALTSATHYYWEGQSVGGND